MCLVPAAKLSSVLKRVQELVGDAAIQVSSLPPPLRPSHPASSPPSQRYWYFGEDLTQL